ncbi:hypothetical protein, partial [Pseudomonas syringae]|uniref:hypothetical protein n=1 Tax=Pseudomonas syringae TaxID=317 RepID=UPI0004A31CA1
SLRQAGQELRSYGHAGLQPTLYAVILFVQNLILQWEIKDRRYVSRSALKSLYTDIWNLSFVLKSSDVIFKDYYKKFMDKSRTQEKVL